MDYPNLREWQNQFIRAITHQEIPKEFPNDISPGGGLSHAQEALNIYARAYIARLTEALGETFEGVWSVLGDHRFFTLAQDYIQNHPSQSYNLSDYGIQFPEFLPTDEFPFLRDLARFEWLFKEIFHAPSPEIFVHTQEFSENTRLRFLPSVGLWKSDFSVYALWQKRKTANFEGSLHQVDHEQNLVIYKTQDGRIWVKELEIWEYELFLLLKKGDSIGEALEKILGVYEISDPLSVQKLFGLPNLFTTI